MSDKHSECRGFLTGALHCIEHLASHHALWQLFNAVHIQFVKKARGKAALYFLRNITVWRPSRSDAFNDICSLPPSLNSTCSFTFSYDTGKSALPLLPFSFGDHVTRGCRVFLQLEISFLWTTLPFMISFLFTIITILLQISHCICFPSSVSPSAYFPQAGEFMHHDNSSGLNAWSPQ